MTKTVQLLIQASLWLSLYNQSVWKQIC